MIGNTMFQTLKEKNLHKNTFVLLLLIAIVFLSSFYLIFTPGPVYSYQNFDEINNIASSKSNYVIQGLRGDLEIFSLDSKANFYGIQGSYDSSSKIALSNDGTYLAVSEGRRVDLYNIQLKRLQFSYVNQSTDVNSITFNSNNSLLVSSTRSGEIVICNLLTSKITVSMFPYQIEEIKAHPNSSLLVIRTDSYFYVRTIKNISDDNFSGGNYLLGSNIGRIFDINGKVAVWSNGDMIESANLVLDGNQLGTYHSNNLFSKYSNNLITNVSLDPTNDYVAVQIASRKVALWTTKLDREITTIIPNNYFSDLKFLSNGLLAGVSGNTVMFYSIPQYLLDNNATIWILYPGLAILLCSVVVLYYFQKRKQKIVVKN